MFISSRLFYCGFAKERRSDNHTLVSLIRLLYTVESLHYFYAHVLLRLPPLALNKGEE